MPTPLQSTSAVSGSGGTISVILGTGGTGIPVTAGSMLIAYVGSGTTGHTASASDNINGAYNSDSLMISSGTICTFPNTLGGTITVTGNVPGTSVMGIIVEEWPNIATASPLDQKQANSGSAATTGTTGTTPTLAQAQELVVAMMALNTNGGSGFAVQSPFTPSPSSPVMSGVTTVFAAGYYFPSTNAGVSATFDWTNSVTFRGCIATYKLSPSGYCLSNHIEF